MLKNIAITGYGISILLFMPTVSIAASDSGKEPYQSRDLTNTQFILGNNNSKLVLSGMLPVPDGMRLVVEHVSVEVMSNDPELDVSCNFYGGNFGVSGFNRVSAAQHHVSFGPLRNILEFFGRNYRRQSSQPLRLYIEEGRIPGVSCFFSRELSLSDSILVSGDVSGYLVKD